MKKHSLRITGFYFTEILVGLKRFEVRKNDRDFQAMDTLHLQEYDAEQGAYSGSWADCHVSEVYKDLPGVQPGYVVMSIVVMSYRDHTGSIVYPELETFRPLSV